MTEDVIVVTEGESVTIVVVSLLPPQLLCPSVNGSECHVEIAAVLEVEDEDYQCPGDESRTIAQVFIGSGHRDRDNDTDSHEDSQEDNRENTHEDTREDNREDSHEGDGKDRKGQCGALITKENWSTQGSLRVYGTLDGLLDGDTTRHLVFYERHYVNMQLVNEFFLRSVEVIISGHDFFDRLRPVYRFHILTLGVFLG